MGRPTLPTKSPKRLPVSGTKQRRRSNNSMMSGPSSSSAVSSAGSSGSTPASANIKVAVRVRPENEREKAGAYNNVINVVDDKMLIFDPKEDQDDFFYQGKKQGRRDLNKKENKDKKFAFDAVFAPGSTNQQVFEGTTKDLVETVFSGYNCSVFAYGATGAGKTFTMLGAQNCPGITFLTMQEIYKKIDSLEDKSCEIGISYLEVYNETVKDLLAPGGLLDIRETGSETRIPGLSVHKPSGPDNILSLLSFGNGNRTQHATDANKESSRSHAVLQVFIKLKDKDAGLSTEVKIAKMSLIDLAGSEKGAVTGNKGARFREGSNINKSLLALGNCINALADGSKYIPYRNSKLTRLLKDSIGGNCRTVMIANVSPSSETFEDTFNTLKYADRAKKIKISLKKNVLNVDFHVAQYAKIVEDLRGEISLLKERIQELENENEQLKARKAQDVNSDPVPNDMEVDSTNSEMAPVGHEIESNNKEIEKLQGTLNRYIERQHDYDDLQRRIKEFEEKNLEQKKEIDILRTEQKPMQGKVSNVNNEELEMYKAKVLELEGRLRSKGEAEEVSTADSKDEALENLMEERRSLISNLFNEQSLLVNLKMRIHFKKQLHERNEKITIGEKDKEKSEVKTSKAVKALDKKVERKEKKVEQLIEDIEKNKVSLDNIFENNPDNMTFKNAQLEIQLLEYKAESRHLSSMIATMGSKLETQDQDLNSTLKVLRKNHLYLRGHDLSSLADKQEYEELRDQLLENKLKWAGQLTEYSDQSEAELLAVNFYSDAARLSLPSLVSEEEEEMRPRSAEQKSLFDGQDTETTVTYEENTVVEKTITDTTPPPCRSEKAFLRSSSSTTFQSLPPTPNLVPQSEEELLPPTPRVFGNNSFEILPATPQLEMSKPAPLLRKESDKSFTSEKEAPLLKSLMVKAAASTMASSPQSTPKRLSEADHKDGSAQKKPKIENINWAVHRESAEVPSTPLSSRNLNETYSPDSQSPEDKAASHSLNETVTLVSNLGKQCDIKSPELDRKNLNSTFAIEDEPMDVDLTGSARNIPFVGDMSVINPPRSKETDNFLSVKSDQSPVKAGMDTPSSPYDRQPRRSPRNSTMPPPSKPGGSAKKSWQPAGAKNSSTTPQNGGKFSKRTLKHSVSTSVLPRQSQQGSNNQPVSFRATINRLHQGVPSSAETRPRKPASGTMSKENPSEKQRFSSTVGNKINSGLGKLKKSVSSANVLKSNNKL